MAKEPSQSRLPLPGMTRIPFPGLLRPPTTAALVRPSQLRPPSTFTKTRPAFYSGLRPPTATPLALKKSSSGDRINTINTTLNMVTKNPAKVIKKFFPKTESMFQTPLRKTGKEADKMEKQSQVLDSIARPLTRSDTFVRTESPEAMLADTPMPALGDEMRGEMCESTPLATAIRKELYTEKTLDSTFNPPSCTSSRQRKQILESTRLSSLGFGNTIDIESPLSNSSRSSNLGFGNTIDVDAEPRDATHILYKVHETQTLNRTRSMVEQASHNRNATRTMDSTKVMGQQMQQGSPQDTANLTRVMKMANEQTPKALHGVTDKHVETAKLLDGSGIHSPASNATYSNPGSTDNLLMIDDVSIPSGFEDALSSDLIADTCDQPNKLPGLAAGSLDETLTALAPDKLSLKLPLNSTMNSERLLDLTQTATTPAKHMKLLNLTRDFIDSPNGAQSDRNTTQLLYMTQLSASCTTTPDRNVNKKTLNSLYQMTPIPSHMKSPLLKQTQSDLVLPTRTPDDDRPGDLMDVDSTMVASSNRADAHQSLQDVNAPEDKPNARFSFGLDLTESTLDCSIELVDVSYSSTILTHPASTSGQNLSSSLSSQQLLRKQHSFELDESLGILTPDQMKEFLDSTATNNLELPLALNISNSNVSHKIALHQLRMDQTPSPEELPLDPVEVKTDINEMVLQHQQQYLLSQSQPSNALYAGEEQHPLMQHQCSESLSLHSEAEQSKSITESITKSTVSKISTSFITSVTSVTSLDTGYQGDGEMSRPASRGACDHSPSNGPLRKGVSRQPSFNQQQQGQAAPIRRQDPMTDSDFFTESDADDVFHRGDRRAQVIDGQLYGPMLQPAASVFISEDPQMEDSCMESSGIFTDVENRCDDDLAQTRHQTSADDGLQDLSPDFECDADSTETVRSNRELSKRSQANSEKYNASASSNSVCSHGQGQLSSSQTSSTIQSSLSTDRLSAATLSNRTSYCSVDGGGGGGVAGSAAGEFKSFSSLDEAFDGECPSQKRPVKLSKSSTTSTTSWCEQPASKQLAAVQSTTSPRKHSSLNSLCAENGVRQKQAEAAAASGPPYNSCKSSAQSITGSDRSFASTASSSNVSSGNRACKTAPGNAALTKHSPRSKTLTKSAKLNKESVAAGAGSGQTPVRKYQHSPNKWDAVMHQIASNKQFARKNYNDVKSKVSSRITLPADRGGGGGGGGGTGNGAGGDTKERPRSASARPGSGSSTSVSPTVRRTPPHSVTFGRTLGAASTGKASKSPELTAAAAAVAKKTDTKRLIQTVKRGRSYSKDSQKSSQSDLSFASGVASVNGVSGGSGGGGSGSGSPKLLAKTPMRAAKKRDVRNLSISPTDLGPPPKTQQTANGSSTRPKPAAITLTQKQFTPSHSTTPSTTSTAASSPTAGSSTSVKGGSPPSKKFQLASRRSDAKVGSPAKTPFKEHNRILNPSITPVPSKTNSKSEAHTELQENSIVLNNNNISTTAPPATAADKLSSGSRGVGRTSSPISKKTSTGGATHDAAHNQEKKSLSKSHSPQTNNTSPAASNVLRKPLLHKQHQPLPHDAPTLVNEQEEAGQEEDVDVDVTPVKVQSRHSVNANLEFDVMQLRYQQQYRDNVRITEALAVMMQYLVFDCDAFACDRVKTKNAQTTEELQKTLLQLDEAKSACSELQDQLCEKDAYYARRENELQALHRCELEKANTSLLEFQSMAKHQIAEIRDQLDMARTEAAQKLKEMQSHLDKAAQHEKFLQQRLQGLEASEQELKERLTQAESSYANRLQLSSEREQELSDRLKSLTKELEKLKASKESNERDLKDKLNLSHDEVSLLRNTRRSLNESGVGSPRNTSSCSSMGNMELSRLQSEAESLRCVLELKQKEISKLSKQNEELLHVSDEKLALQAKISLLESKNEMLQSELEIKSEKEKEYLRQMDEVQKAYNHETVKRTRLSYDNEALQWQLKQRSEQLHLVETKLQELSAHDISASSLTNRSSLNGSALASSTHAEEVSPPSSPVIKGVIEKLDSVSWVLEMDDETPEAAATKMVKRAGSFRSVERSPSTRRQLSVSANGTPSISISINEDAAPNPLTQSMSATSVIREHSKADTNEFLNKSHPRIRSKSVSVKSCEGAQPQKMSTKVARQLSTGSARKESEAGGWSEPSQTSSPYVMRPRSSTMKMDNGLEEEVLFRRNNAKLITCDTSALNKGERLEMRSLPSHPSVQDLKAVKKCPEIQESAGEAMVSGTNSEDESCSASSDDVVSSASSTANSDSTCASHQMKHSRMSFEKVLLMEKINNLSSTPMEVSWSEDADNVVDSSRL